jgi:hypothetical protein
MLVARLNGAVEVCVGVLQVFAPADNARLLRLTLDLLGSLMASSRQSVVVAARLGALPLIMGAPRAAASSLVLFPCTRRVCGDLYDGRHWRGAGVSNAAIETMPRLFNASVGVLLRMVVQEKVPAAAAAMAWRSARRAAARDLRGAHRRLRHVRSITASSRGRWAC